jgi:hypothetical protein
VGDVVAQLCRSVPCLHQGWLQAEETIGRETRLLLPCLLFVVALYIARSAATTKRGRVSRPIVSATNLSEGTERGGCVTTGELPVQGLPGKLQPGLQAMDGVTRQGADVSREV